MLVYLVELELAEDLLFMQILYQGLEQHFLIREAGAGIRNWESQLEQHYKTAEEMLGAIPNPKLFDADIALKELSVQTKL